MAARVAWFIAALALIATPAAAQTADNVLLVVNSDSAASKQIAAHYIEVRHIPDRNVVRLHTAETDTITRPEYARTIEGPVSDWLTKNRLQDQVLYIVLTKGIPLRIDGTLGLTGTMASVDSELTLLYRQMVQSPISIVSQLENPNRDDGAAGEGTRFARQANLYFVTALTREDPQLSLLQRPVIGENVPVVGRIDNPYFLGDKDVKTAARFSRSTSDLYLVTRLDGLSVDDVIKLIDRGASPVRTGEIVLDQKAYGDRGGDIWLEEAAARLKALTPAPAVQLETTRAIATAAGPVLGYFSWGSNDPTNQRRDMGLTFANGAIGGMFVSTDGRTFHEPPAGWQPAMAGSSTGGQSLAGDLVREGITGVSGNVAEPLLDAIVRPQILFPAYLSGFNLAESFYLAMPFLSWQEIVIGDPLCAPFPHAPVAQADIDKGIDADTDMPAIFAQRRLDVITRSNLKPEGLKLFLKATVARLNDKPEAEVYALLSRAVTVEPRFTLAHLILAQSAEARGDVDEAVTHYRPVSLAEPDNAVALNNLAYLLADRKNAAKEALPLAERAYRLSAQAPIVADTLGWVQFKLGDNAAALPLADRAAQFEPKNVDILVHAATIHAAVNDIPRARTLLDAALKVDPKAADRADVKALAARIR